MVSINWCFNVKNGIEIVEPSKNMSDSYPEQKRKLLSSESSKEQSSLFRSVSPKSEQTPHFSREYKTESFGDSAPPYQSSKPTDQENFERVISQLHNYVVALSFRANLPLENIKCAWFDSSKIYSFEPADIVIGLEKEKVGYEKVSTEKYEWDRIGENKQESYDEFNRQMNLNTKNSIILYLNKDNTK